MTTRLQQTTAIRLSSNVFIIIAACIVISVNDIYTYYTTLFVQMITLRKPDLFIWYSVYYLFKQKSKMTQSIAMLSDVSKKKTFWFQRCAFTFTYGLEASREGSEVFLSIALGQGIVLIKLSQHVFYNDKQLVLLQTNDFPYNFMLVIKT